MFNNPNKRRKIIGTKIIPPVPKEKWNNAIYLSGEENLKQCLYIIYVYNHNTTIKNENEIKEHQIEVYLVPNKDAIIAANISSTYDNLLKIGNAYFTYDPALDKKYYWLTSIFINPSFQGRKIGSYLLQFADKYLENWKIACIVAQVSDYSLSREGEILVTSCILKKLLSPNRCLFPKACAKGEPIPQPIIDDGTKDDESSDSEDSDSILVLKITALKILAAIYNIEGENLMDNNQYEEAQQRFEQAKKNADMGTHLWSRISKNLATCEKKLDWSHFYKFLAARSELTYPKVNHLKKNTINIRSYLVKKTIILIILTFWLLPSYGKIVKCPRGSIRYMIYTTKYQCKTIQKPKIVTKRICSPYILPLRYKRCRRIARRLVCTSKPFIRHVPQKNCKHVKYYSYEKTKICKPHRIKKIICSAFRKHLRKRNIEVYR